MKLNVKWVILGVGVGCFTLGMMADHKIIVKEEQKRKPLLSEAWAVVVVKAVEAGLTKTEAKALVKNVYSRVPFKFELEDVNRIVDEEIEFLTIVR